MYTNLEIETRFMFNNKVFKGYAFFTALGKNLQKTFTESNWSKKRKFE